jgi:uncharacterized protein involved in exopolysaccharide biosynthesis
MELEEILGLGSNKSSADDLDKMEAPQLRALVRRLAVKLKAQRDLKEEIGAQRTALDSAKSFLAEVKKSHAKILARM